MAQIPTDRDPADTVGDTPTEHAADHNAMAVDHNALDAVGGPEVVSASVILHARMMFK